MADRAADVSAMWPSTKTQWTIGPAAARVVSADPAEFRDKYNLRPFQFRHTLAESPLFAVPRLVRVAQRMLECGDSNHFVARSGKTALADAQFKHMPMRERLAETVRQLAESQVWLKLSSAHTVDPEYDALLRQVLREVEELSGQPLHESMTWSSLTIFLASPHVTTPYHIDHESNFLFQIHGSKDVSLHDPAARDVIPDEQLERFYAGDFEAAQYRPELQPRGTIFHLEPGIVVHHPPLAPHWVQNGDDISVSVSIGFCLRSLDRRAHVYQVNHFLRRMGMQPTPPGKSKLRDGLKAAGVGMLSKAHPTSPDEILFSGMSRLAAPPRAVKRWVRALRHHP